MEKKIEIEEIIKEKAPHYRMIYMEADVENADVSEELRDELLRMASGLTELYEVADINRRPAIAATRAAYKACGKDPNRYRPSQEQLMRRVVRGLGLYNVSQLVDTGNLLSLATGWSVGVFDRDRIEGPVITVGVGREGEPYEGIGRGELNIAGMPVIRDAAGGFGTPTSDHERTKTTPDTRHISVTMHLFDSREADIPAIIDMMRDLFTRHCNATAIEIAVTE